MCKKNYNYKIKVCVLLFKKKKVKCEKRQVIRLEQKEKGWSMDECSPRT